MPKNSTKNSIVNYRCQDCGVKVKYWCDSTTEMPETLSCVKCRGERVEYVSQHSGVTAGYLRTDIDFTFSRFPTSLSLQLAKKDVERVRFPDSTPLEELRSKIIAKQAVLNALWQKNSLAVEPTCYFAEDLQDFVVGSGRTAHHYVREFGTVFWSTNAPCEKAIKRRQSKRKKAV